MANIILIAGTHHGGWYWDSLAHKLREADQRVFAPSLAGLDDENPIIGPINLDTHINQVLDLVHAENLADVVLVGSSYGGMVITGVADLARISVKHLVYLDAALPRPGQSEWDLNAEWLREKYMSTTLDGVNIQVPDEFLRFRPRLMPHPLATKLQPLHFSQQRLDSLDKTYVHAERGFGPGVEHFFAEGYRRAQTEPGWSTQSLAAGHDLAAELPDQVLKIILQVCE